MGWESSDSSGWRGRGAVRSDPFRLNIVLKPLLYACVRPCVRACVRACLCVCVRVSVCVLVCEND